MSRSVAVIPIRGSIVSKTRLTPLFHTPQRQRLVWAMLDHVVTTIWASRAVDGIVIVTRDADAVRAHLKALVYCTTLTQPPGFEGLNGAMEYGRGWAQDHGFDSLLLLPADLPIIAPSDVESIVATRSSLVIAPDWHRDGTNAMFLRLAEVRHAEETAGERFCFMMGQRSFARHAEAARRLGLSCAAVHLPELELDLDTPDDWERMPAPLRERYLAIMEGAVTSVSGHRSMRNS